MNIYDIRWINLNSVCDDRGCLTAIEGEEMIPFAIKRVFYMHSVKNGSNRGGHAHRDTDQFAVAVHGSLKIIVSNGSESRSVILDNPGWGITLPRMTWTSLVDFSDDAVCMVLASTHYDRSKSIRTWSEYLVERGVQQCPEVMAGSVLCRPEM
jgi:dTDP-4-dehydrorhamnose 3,5-epimerase-like enzyme